MGCKYIERSGMRENGKWATEVKILTTTKCFQRDIFTCYQNKWQRHCYLADYSDDAIYLINEKEHFNMLCWDHKTYLIDIKKFPQFKKLFIFKP